MHNNLEKLTGQLALAAALTGFAGLAVAQATYDELDANQDGLISQEEAQADEELAATFDGVDVDEDGSVNQGEFARFEEAVGRTDGAAEEPVY